MNDIVNDQTTGPHHRMHRSLCSSRSCLYYMLLHIYMYAVRVMPILNGVSHYCQSIRLGLGVHVCESRCLQSQLRAFREPINVCRCAGDNNTPYAKHKYANMATSHQENTALLTEHFRYTPLVRSTLNVTTSNADSYRHFWTTSSTQSTSWSSAQLQ